MIVYMTQTYKIKVVQLELLNTKDKDLLCIKI